MATSGRRNVWPWLWVSALGFCLGDGFAGAVFGTVSESPQYIPLTGAHVYLEGKRPQVDSQLTDSAGAFRFEGVTDCGLGCDVRVRLDGFWTKASDFTLGADENKRVDMALERIHALSLRVVKAEDTARTIAAAQAVLSSDANEPYRCAKADSTGRMRFRDLQSFTGYLLTVAAPGRKANSNMLHFHDPVSENFLRVVLDSDAAQSGKSVHGILTVKGAGPAAGEKVILGCRNDQAAADLFGTAGPDGRYAIEGVPAACDSAMLHAGEDSLTIALPGKDTTVDWDARFPLPAAARPARVPRGKGASRPGPWRGYDLTGRRLEGIRPRSIPAPGRPAP